MSKSNLIKRCVYCLLIILFYLIITKRLKPDYTRTEDLVTDILDLLYKDMTYQRELLLPDVLHDPVSADTTEAGDTDNVLNKLTEVIKSGLIY